MVVHNALWTWIDQTLLFRPSHSLPSDEAAADAVAGALIPRPSPDRVFARRRR